MDKSSKVDASGLTEMKVKIQGIKNGPHGRFAIAYSIAIPDAGKSSITISDDVFKDCTGESLPETITSELRGTVFIILVYWREWESKEGQKGGWRAKKMQYCSR
jgi:hypothetical protein